MSKKRSIIIDLKSSGKDDVDMNIDLKGYFESGKSSKQDIEDASIAMSDITFAVAGLLERAIAISAIMGADPLKTFKLVQKEVAERLENMLEGQEI